MAVQFAPVVAGAAKKLAVTTATDKDGRKILLGILGVCAGILLIIMLAVQYILTYPLRALWAAGLGDVRTEVLDIRAHFGIDDYVTVGGTIKHVYSNNVDEVWLDDGDPVPAGYYLRYSFVSGGKKVLSDELPAETDSQENYGSVAVRARTIGNLKYFNQFDSAFTAGFNRAGYKNGTACGPTSVAIVLATYGKDVDPVTVAAYAAGNGLYIPGSGSSHSLVPRAAAYFGCSAEGVGKNTAAVRSALSDGCLVIALMGPGHFTSAGPFLVIRELTSKGTVLVADPASESRSQKEWSLDLIASELKYTDTTGPFWVIRN